MSHFQDGKVVIKKEFRPFSIGNIFMSHFQDGKVVIKKEFMPFSISSIFYVSFPRWKSCDQEGIQAIFNR